MRHLRRFAVYTLLFMTLAACKEDPLVNDLEGYWEIEQADLPGGNTKEYAISLTLDHYQLESDSSGYKTKVTPRLDGSFQTSGHQEYFRVEEKDGALLLHYQNSLTQYTEKVIRLKPEQLILINDRDMKYTYKRFKQLELE